MTKNDYTAVYQDGYSVFGVGRNIREAIEDAMEWVDHPETLEDDIEKGKYGVDGDMILIDATKEYVESVLGNVILASEFVEHDRLIMTHREYESIADEE